VLDGLSRSGRFVVEHRIALVRVGIGMVGRVGRHAPDISTEYAITAALLDAATIIINQASTGLYLENLLSRLGIFERVADRLVRLPTGRAVMERMADAPLDAIGFGAVTEIEVHKALGVRLAALLPDELHNYTNYEAASSAAPQAHPAADRFIAFVGSPDSDACFTASGMERAAPSAEA
jgi:molybdate transport system substrate-binding protein